MSTDRPPASLADFLVERFLGRQGPDLLLGGVKARTLAAAYGTPLYVYDAAVLRRNYGMLRDALAGFADVFYSIKANPNPEVARVFRAEGAGLEIASAAEFLIARAAGCPGKDIVFAGPGKGRQELERVIAEGIGEIHLESFEEVDLVADIAQALDTRVAVAIRVNPVAAAEGGAMRMGGRPAAFGFDEETLDPVIDAVAARPRLDLVGVHMFAGTQILDAKVLLGQWGHAIGLAATVARRIGRPLRTLDLGGGLGVPYHAGDTTLDLEALRAGLPALQSLRTEEPLLSTCRFIVEPGRFLTASAGVYLASVRAVKLSRGTRFVVLDGGMNHHLAASGNLGQVIKRDYPIVAASAMDATERAPAVVVGPLCTPLDTLGRQALLPELTQGSLVAVLQSGAYGLSASPVGFLSHPTPAEVIVDGGEHRLIRAAGSFEAPLRAATALPG